MYMPSETPCSPARVIALRMSLGLTVRGTLSSSMCFACSNPKKYQQLADRKMERNELADVGTLSASLALALRTALTLPMLMRIEKDQEIVVTCSDYSHIT
jgi:hypothetical protein